MTEADHIIRGDRRARVAADSETKPRLSGWCSGLTGCTSPRAHETCQTRMDSGRMHPCGCPAFGGHHLEERT